MSNAKASRSNLTDRIAEYIPQGHRYDIYEDIGCYPATYNTWVAIVCVTGWPIAIGCVSAVYCSTPKPLPSSKHI